MDNSQYHQLVDIQWTAIEEAIDNSDADIDYETNGNVLTLEFEDGSQIVINRQEPKHEIWLASKSGGYHFSYQNEQWICSKTGLNFNQLLNQECTLHAGEQISF